MMPKQIARELSTIQRNRLIEYVAGPRHIALNNTDNSLRTEQLLQPAASNRTNPRPSKLMLTELGRAVACIILGQYADALVACGLADRVFTESQLSSAIKLSSRRTSCPEQLERLLADADCAAASAEPMPVTA